MRSQTRSYTRRIQSKLAGRVLKTLPKLLRKFASSWWTFNFRHFWPHSSHRRCGLFAHSSRRRCGLRCGPTLAGFSPNLLSHDTTKTFEKVWVDLVNLHFMSFSPLNILSQSPTFWTQTKIGHRRTCCYLSCSISGWLGQHFNFLLLLLFVRTHCGCIMYTGVSHCTIWKCNKPYFTF